MGVQRNQYAYSAIEGAISRLTGTVVRIVTTKKIKGRRKAASIMNSTILVGNFSNEETGKIVLTINPYFLSMYAEGLITNIDDKFRAEIPGDTAKALYRFFQGQREADYSCHILTLAKAINLNLDQETWRLRGELKIALGKLKSKKYLSAWKINKSDIIWVRKLKGHPAKKTKQLDGKV